MEFNGSISAHFKASSPGAELTVVVLPFLISYHQMCACVRRVLSISLSTSKRVTDKPAILLLYLWNRVHSLLSAARVIVGFSAELTEHIPNVSHTPGMYLLDTDLAGTHTALQECLSALFAGWKYKRNSSRTISGVMLIKAWDIDAIMLILCVTKGQKLHTLQDVIPPYMPQICTLCTGWKTLPSWISFK